jgi:hypothetical protein
MAQLVSYWENHCTFEEGPFVLVYCNGWRVEAQFNPAPSMPALPDASVYKLKGELGWVQGKTEDKEMAMAVVDRLNEMVRTGEIVDSPTTPGKHYWVRRGTTVHNQL